LTDFLNRIIGESVGNVGVSFLITEHLNCVWAGEGNCGDNDANHENDDPNKEKDNAVDYWKSNLFFARLAETSNSAGSNENGGAGESY